MDLLLVSIWLIGFLVPTATPLDDLIRRDERKENSSLNPVGPQYKDIC